jgi:formamidopyrimidine-DNA glycosylase
MPELPDVEIFKRYLNATSLHQKIVRTEIRDKSLLGETSDATLYRILEENSFESSFRHGKYLFVQVGEMGWLVLHFGMTGFLKYYQNDREAPDHIRLLIHFNNHYKLAYDCQRKLGLIDFTRYRETFITKKNLGPDPISSQFSYMDFKGRISETRGVIKSFLMNQKWIAGIGNIYSDEILFQAGIHPQAEIKHLSDKKLRKIYDELYSVLETAIEKHVQPENFPRNYLLPNRNVGEKCPKCGGTIQKKTVNGYYT